MKLASRRDGSRDGALIVVNSSLTRYVQPGEVARTLQSALDDWPKSESPLREIFAQLEAGVIPGLKFDPDMVMAPLPRPFGWVDGTSYLSHMERARALRGATLPDDFRFEPLMGERIPGPFLAAQDPVPLKLTEDVGMDIEGEVGVILGDVPVGVSVEEAGSYIRLVTLINDVSLRTVLAETIKRGRSATLFAKPYPSMAPVAVTPDALGQAWDGDLLRLPLRCWVNGTLVASPNGGEGASFTFPELIAYCARYRPLPAGLVLAMGTLSNADDERGGACIAERRLIETRQTGAPVTPYLGLGDTLRIEMFDGDGASLFGAIRQTVVAE